MRNTHPPYSMEEMEMTRSGGRKGPPHLPLCRVWGETEMAETDMPMPIWSQEGESSCRLGTGTRRTSLTHPQGWEGTE